jgi:Papain-like cysteine protease AvrRpt2
MLPEDWSRDREPLLLALPGDLEELFEIYLRELKGGRIFERVVRRAIAVGADSVLVERPYIDADYRSEFAGFYAEVYRDLPDRAHRLHFLDRAARNYCGYVTIRPILGRPVSRTMLEPPPALAPHVSCLARSKASPYGAEFTAQGFPFISQDYQYGVCAHAAIWMVALYFHLHFGRPRIHLSDIVEAARQPAYGHRRTPSNGLTHPQMNAALETLGMSAINYIFGQLPEGETPEMIACRYLNSRLPVIVLGSGHARVLVGYGADVDAGGLFFVCHDDARGPYRAIGDPGRGRDEGSPDGHWERLVVPLPGRIYLAGEAAEQEGGLALRRELAKHEELRHHVAALGRGERRLRTYVTTIADYLHRLRDRGISADVQRWHALTGASHWVWVVELQDTAAAARGRECVLGEVIIDTTSDDREPNFLSANLPGYKMRWVALGAPTDTQAAEQRELYETGCALHVATPTPPAPGKRTGLARLRPRRR